MKQSEILDIALQQSAWDMNCSPTAFLSDKPVVVPFCLGANARKYLSEPITCNLVTYGRNVVASTIPEVRDIVEQYVNRHLYYRCFETPAMQWLNDRMMERGHKVCYMAEYYLPELDRLRPVSCAYDLRVMCQNDFAGLYTPEWSNALCEKRKHLDILGVGAFDDNQLIGLAACSADAEHMWQIGIDVLPDYRMQHIASALTSRLALEILDRGKVPFYCSAWSNIASVRNAVKSGFVPAWVELTVKPSCIVDELNLITEGMPDG